MNPIDRIPPQISGVWLATHAQVLDANRVSASNGWSARFSDATLKRVLDDKARAIIVPMSRRNAEAEHYYRCLFCMKCADKNDVVSTFMDFSGEAISGFERANQTALEKIARLLIEAQVQVNLDEV